MTFKPATLPFLFVRLFLVLGLLLLGQWGSLLQTHASAASPDNSFSLTNSVPEAVTSGKATLIGPYNQSQLLRLVFGLQPPHPAEEEQFLQDLQNKKSPLFHQYLTADAWNARFSPAPQDEQAVVDWASAQGLTVTSRYANRLLVDVAAPVSVIERTFNVQINTYQLGTASFFANDKAPTLPSSLRSIVHAVLGLNSLEVAKPSVSAVGTTPNAPYVDGPAIASGQSAHRDGSRAALLAALKSARPGTVLPGVTTGAAQPNYTSGFYDPTDLYSSQAYDWNALDALGHCCNPYHNPSTESPPATSIAIATSGSLQQSDMDGYVNRYTYLAYDYQPVYIDGTPSCCNDETTLDVEWATAMANSFGCYCDTAKVWVYEGANSNLSTFTDIYNHMLSDGHARSFSTSWGCTEYACASSGTMDTDHNIFNSMLGQGWTVSALTHDQGAYDDCTAGTPKLDYPSSDPDSLAVGGSSLNAFGSFVSETAWTGPNNSCGGNAGGGGGGVSAKYGVPGYQSGMGYSGRTTPDVVLNSYYGENTYFSGGWHGYGGTSISTPEVAAFIAQENAYLLAMGNVCGSGSPCGTVGQVDYAIYANARGGGAGTPPHNPFYDITSGCNGNGAGTGYCAGSGYDLATGWGSFNALQLAWAINWQDVPDSGRPTVSFSGPTTGRWYNYDNTINFTVADTGGGAPASGVAGFSAAWDGDPGDPNNPGTPGGGNSFYSGPANANATSGSLDLAAAGQGCHTANVRAWDNMGLGSGDVTYGSVCYDTVTPNIDSVTLSPASPTNAATVTTSATADDPAPGSGVANIYYYVNTATNGTNSGTWIGLGSSVGASGHLTWSTAGLTDGVHLVSADPEDVAGNFLYYVNNHNTARPLTLDKTAPVSTAALAGTLAGGGAYLTPVMVTLHATDNLSGVAHTYYQVDGGPVTTYSTPFAVTALGSHVVTYHSTDLAGNVESTKSISFTIVKYRATTTTLTGAPNPSTFGQTVTFTAKTVPQVGSGTPTGTVTFKDGVTTLGTGTLSGGIATFSTGALGVGAHTITADYAGDATFGISVGSTSQTVISKVTLVSSANPSVHGQVVTFTASVSPVPVSGTVTFKDGATVLGTIPLVSGVAKPTINTLAVGVHSLTASFSGSGISSPLSQTVNRANSTVTLVGSPNPSVHGQVVTLTATVHVTAPGTGIPTGVVTFKDGATTLGAATLNVSGVATLSIGSLSVGAHTITASYAGDTNVSASTGTTAHTVNKANSTVTLVGSPNPSVHGQPVTLTATVHVTAPGAGVPTGSVIFKDGLTTLGAATLNVGGVATFSTSSLSVGAHTITASYAGDANVNASTGTTAHTVNKANSTVTLVGSPNPSVHGQPVTLTATVHVAAPGAGIPTGAVTFKDGLTTLGAATLNVGGVATFNTSSLSVGAHTITASYAGDANVSASTGTTAHTVS